MVSFEINLDKMRGHIRRFLKITIEKTSSYKYGKFGVKFGVKMEKKIGQRGVVTGHLILERYRFFTGQDKRCLNFYIIRFLKFLFSISEALEI